MRINIQRPISLIPDSKSTCFGQHHSEHINAGGKCLGGRVSISYHIISTQANCHEEQWQSSQPISYSMIAKYKNRHMETDLLFTA